MQNLSKTAKDIIRNIFVLSAVEVILGTILIIIFFETSLILGYVFGIIYGTIIAAARTAHLEKSINASIKLDDQPAAVKYFRFMYVIRTVATAAALVIAFWLNPIISVAAVAISLLNAPIVVYVYKFMGKDGR